MLTDDQLKLGVDDDDQPAKELYGPQRGELHIDREAVGLIWTINLRNPIIVYFGLVDPIHPIFDLYVIIVTYKFPINKR